jgi:phosphoglycolate phosphatase
VTVRLVVFDLDGTLVDSARDLATAVNAMLGRVAPGRPPLPFETVKAFVGEGAGVLMQRVLHAARLDVAPEAALSVFLECYERCLLDETRLYPGVAEVLDAVKDRTLAVLTNKQGALSRAILEGLGVASRFARIWGPDDAGARKPDPRGLLRLVAELGFTPPEAVLVGDSAVDVKTARAAGVRTVAVTYGLNPATLRDVTPDAILHDIAALPGLLGGEPGVPLGSTTVLP